MTNLVRRIYDVLSGFGLTCIVLILLLGLTWQGTLAQVQLGLHEAQKNYFDSYIWWQQIGPLSLPMPGANLLLWVLFVNLVCGGIVRMRRHRSTIGILIVHLGIVLMLAAGFVKFHLGDEGYIRFYEGQTKAEFVSHFKWELAVTEVASPEHGGSAREFIVPGEWFEDLPTGRIATYTSPELPFDIALRDWIPNARPQPQGSDDLRSEVIDGFGMVEIPKDTEAKRNIAAVTVELRDKATGQTHRGQLWGVQLHPWTVVIDGVVYGIDLRKKSFPLGFDVRLDKFTKTDHPGINSPRDFRSRVTRTEEGFQETVEISMNEPMRHGGFIFFQSQWAESDAASRGSMYSVLAVARNPSDKWPEISCWVIAAGLLLHFLTKLIRYAKSQHAQQVQQQGSNP